LTIWTLVLAEDREPHELLWEFHAGGTAPDSDNDAIDWSEMAHLSAPHFSNATLPSVRRSEHGLDIASELVKIVVAPQLLHLLKLLAKRKRPPLFKCHCAKSPNGFKLSGERSGAERVR
jgi:hypothetical protein